MALCLRATLSLRHIQLIGSRAIFTRAPYHNRMIHQLGKSVQNNQQYKGIQYKTLQTSARYMNTSPATDEDIDDSPVDRNEQSSNYTTKQLTRAFSRFESICARRDHVSESEFVRVFNSLTLAVERVGPPNDTNTDHYLKISAIAGTLLRSCGKSMVSTAEKARELLAGNLWTFIKEKQVPIDISHYNSLIRTLNENKTNFEPKTILNEIKNANLKPDRITYQRLIHQYCSQGNIQEATALLEVMKDSNMELNETVFASLIIGYNKQPTPPSMSEIFDLMRVNGIEPGNKTYTAAIVSKAQSSKDPDAINQVKDLLKMASDEDVSFTNAQLAELLVALLQLKEKHEIVKELLFQAEKCLRGPISDRYLILSSLVRVGHHVDAANLYWKQHFSERALETKRVGGYLLESMVHHHDVPIEFIIEQCDKLISEGHHSDPYSDLYFKGASCGNLAAVRASLKKMAEEGRARGPHYWPLIAQAKDEQDMLRALKNDLVIDSFTSDELVDTFSNWVLPKLNGDIKKLLDINEKELHLDKNIIATAYLDYSIQINKLEDAVQFLKDTQPDDGLIQEVDEPEDVPDSDNDQTRRNSSLNREFPIRRILNRVAETTNNPELVTKAYELCHIPLKSVSVQCLQPLIEVHLKNDDFNGALEKFLRVSHDHKKTPCSRELMTVCLNNKDPESLQKVMQAVSDIRGQTAALLDLAICCLKVKKFNQAQKILNNPSLRIWPEKIYELARRMTTENNLEMLESFVKLTRDIPDVNKDVLYDILIKYYARTNQAERALHLWNTMQEDDFEPSRKIMSMIADILEESGMEVPFHRPPKLNSILDRVRKSRARPVRKTVDESED